MNRGQEKEAAFDPLWGPVQLEHSWSWWGAGGDIGCLGCQESLGCKKPEDGRWRDMETEPSERATEAYEKVGSSQCLHRKARSLSRDS